MKIIKIPFWFFIPGATFLASFFLDIALELSPRRRGGETKTLKRGGGKLGQGVDALKRKAAGTPLPTMLYFFGDVFIVYYSL